LSDPIGPVDPRTLRTDEGALQVQAEDSVPACDRAGCRDGASDLPAGIGNQRWQAGRSAIAAVRPRNDAHAVGRRLIVEKNAAAAVDLKIDEAGRQEDAGRETHLRPVSGNLAPGSKRSNAAVPDQYCSFGMPAVTVENTVSQYGVTGGGWRIVSAWAH
jgi:hypothetical protein